MAVKMKSTEKFDKLFKPVVESMSYEYWGCEHIVQGAHSVLRIYVDREQGVLLDDCAKISRQIGALLDVEDVVRGAYHLEVSSPGIERWLFTPEQFVRYLDHTVDVRLQAPLEGRRKLLGLLKQVNQDAVTMLLEDESFVVPFSAIAKAKVKAN